MKILCVFGAHNYGVPSRGQGYEYTNFIPALRRLGHEVAFFESLNKKRYSDFAELNYEFLKAVEGEKPDIILCVLMTYEIWTETLSLVKNNSDSILINWSTDDSWKYEQFSRFVSPCFHLYATTYSSAILKAQKDSYSNFFLTQWAACAEKLAEPGRAEECRYRVSFVGSAYGNRTRWIDDLKKNGIHVDCFGHGWKNGPVSAEEISSIMRQSYISLSFSDSGFFTQGNYSKKSGQIKARIFEVTGAGGFLITENAEGIDRYFLPDREIIVFDNVESLTEKIRYFLSHPDERDCVARAGFVRTRNDHTYDIRFRNLIEKIGMTDREAERKRGFILDQNQFAALERRYRSGIALKLLRKVLEYPCIALWGKARGPRAARRIVFELSWRLFGAKTYSAGGWPGRMFYSES
jgi:spore maturation protein CgeB